MFPDSVTFEISTELGARPLSWVSMFCTNDGFTGLDSIKLPAHVGDEVTTLRAGYDYVRSGRAGGVDLSGLNFITINLIPGKHPRARSSARAGLEKTLTAGAPSSGGCPPRTRSRSRHFLLRRPLRLRMQVRARGSRLPTG
jgi:hypothetical protein